MAHTIESLALMRSSPGLARDLKIHRFGTAGARPKVYLQAALHANEIPGLLILHHLMRLLKTAEAAGEPLGEVVVVPYANPIGLGENVLGTHIGREALDGGGNFNRGWPNLAAAVADPLASKLGSDPKANIATVRAAIAAHLDSVRPRTELEHLQTELLRLAHDADFVFDLHTELEAMVALVVATWALTPLEDLIREFRPDVVLQADSPPLFDTVLSRPFHDLAATFGPDHPIPQACVGATFEMRGVGDVADDVAREDARRIFRFLQRINGTTDSPPPSANGLPEPTDHGAVEFLRAPAAGVLVYRSALGAMVEAGEVIAELVDPAADDPDDARIPIRSTQAGRLYARRSTKLVRPNDVIGKVAGKEILEHSGRY